MALAGMLTFPTIVVLVLAALVANVAGHDLAIGAMRGFSAVSAGLIAGAAIRLLPALKGHILGWRICALLAITTFVCIAVLRLPLLWVLVVVGGSSFALAWWRLLRQATALNKPVPTEVDP